MQGHEDFDNEELLEAGHADHLFLVPARLLPLTTATSQRPVSWIVSPSWLICLVGFVVASLARGAGHVKGWRMRAGYGGF
jgi:hypothetical protein